MPIAPYIRRGRRPVFSMKKKMTEGKMMNSAYYTLN
jgi:hypothetical protein